VNERRSQSWKPLVHLSSTLGAVAIVLALGYGAATLIDPRFSIFGLRRAEGKILLAVAAALAYGSVLGTTGLLRRFFGRQFGTYLDDPENDLTELGPGHDRRCRRCGSSFQAYHHDAHATGFCSQSCREVFSKSASAARLKS
jgi:hypothetical protein